ncbi:aldo/keto reductase [Bifidobacterium mongoliense]|uniref:aldo/keto reductase n=1 Tax=Bifidobacterium mongoliense TaxID=518643 RepID=UPI0030F46245
MTLSDTYTPDPSRYETMPYRHVGRSGLKLPAISLGSWHNFGDTGDFDTMRRMCRTAFDHGITHFDLANVYGPEVGSAERNTGRILREDFAGHRDELAISTKAGFEMGVGPYDNWGGRKHLLSSLDQSLQRLGLEYVDVFYHHRPDPHTPLEETMGALAHMVERGKALYVGLSNYDGPTLRRASAILDELHTPFVINQNRYNILDRHIEHDGLKDAATDLGKGLITYSPLAQGLLTDRYLNGIPQDSRVAHDGRFLYEDDVRRVHETVVQLNALASERGQSLAEMSLAWLLRDPTVTSVLVGASRPEQILDDLGALNNMTFSDDELGRIETAVGTQSV